MASKLRQLLQVSEKTLRRNGRCYEHQRPNAVDESDLEWRQVVRKEHFGGTKMLK